jgi:ribosomal protein S20
MSRQEKPEAASGAREEARNLAKEALEEVAHGNKEEGSFLAQEAKALDPAAAKEVLKDRAGTPEKGPAKGPAKGKQ